LRSDVNVSATTPHDSGVAGREPLQCVRSGSQNPMHSAATSGQQRPRSTCKTTLLKRRRQKRDADTHTKRLA
jgi:hypothetical protein